MRGGGSNAYLMVSYRLPYLTSTIILGCWVRGMSNGSRHS